MQSNSKKSNNKWLDKDNFNLMRKLNQPSNVLFVSKVKTRENSTLS
jgi:hypothetical protein